MSNGTKLAASPLEVSYKRCSRYRYRNVTPRVTPVPRRRSGAFSGQTAQGDRDPQGETVPPGRGRVVGEFGDAPEPVPHRVRVHEQQPGGGLKRRTLFQVGGEGVEQGVPAAQQRLVHV